jgi:CHAT domain-containing protein/ElaB/YqjD/DUF883 family membrane-anchored ribosome-binding protein
MCLQFNLILKNIVGLSPNKNLQHSRNVNSIKLIYTVLILNSFQFLNAQNIANDLIIYDCKSLRENISLLHHDTLQQKIIKDTYSQHEVTDGCDYEFLKIACYYAEVLILESNQKEAIEVWNLIIKKSSFCFETNQDTCFLRMMIMAGHNIENYSSFQQSSQYIFKTYDKLKSSPKKIDCKLTSEFLYLPMTANWDVENFKQCLYYVNLIIDICKECKEIYSDDYAYYLYLKGFIHAYLYESEESNQCFLLASDMFEKTESGRKSHYYRNIQFNLYTFFKKQEYIEKSLILTKQVLDEAEKSNDEDKSTEYNIEMVRLYSYTGNYDSAFFFINKTFTKLQNSVKLKNSVYHTIFLKEAINTTLKSKNYNLADSLIQELEKIYQKSGSLSHNKKNDIKNYKANLFESQNRMKEAYTLRKEILGTIDSLYGKESHYYFSEEYMFSGLLHKMDSFYQAFIIADRWIKRYIDLTNQRNKYLTSSDLAGMLQNFNSYYNAAFASLCNIKEKIDIDDLYNKWIFKQGFIYYRHQKLNAVKQKMPEIKTLESELRELQGELSKISKKNPEKYRNLEKLALEKERALVKKLSGDTTILYENFVQKIFEKLKENEILIEIIQHPDHYKTKQSTVWISALVLNPAIGKVEFIPLIKKDELIKLAGKKNDFENINSFYSSEEITKAIIRNIIPQITDKKRIYLISNGMFRNINLSSMAYKGKTFGDYFDVVNFLFARNLLSDKKVETPHLNNAFLVGNIDYTIFNNDQLDTSLLEQNVNNQARKSLYPPLSNSADEIDFISKNLRSKDIETTVFDKIVFKEDLMKKLQDENRKQPDLIHIATHTHFDTSLLFKHSIELNRFNNKYLEEDISLKISSLVLSPDEKSEPHTDQNLSSCLLSSFDISKMNLDSTKLVILSACFSGYGIQSGTENTYGFTRAFTIAGADKVMISLWNLYDYPTTVFMKYFYESFLSQNSNPREALKLTRNHMKKEKYEPYYWAGFVLFE